MPYKLALENIRNYIARYSRSSHVSVWHHLPVARRSAVLVLLFVAANGELRVLLTKRSRKLRSFSGHVSFPGGRSDTGLESEWDTARREAYEEIGLPNHEAQLQQMGLELEKLTILPSFLARTMLAVRPCVGILKTTSGAYQVAENTMLKLKLNPGESSSIFSVPLRDFFPGVEDKECISSSTFASSWAGIRWNWRQMVYGGDSAAGEASWIREISDLSGEEGEEEAQSRLEEERRRKGSEKNVWGLTANILYELACIAYGSANKEIGEEELITALLKGGQFGGKERSEFEKGIIEGRKGVTFKDGMKSEDWERLKSVL